MTLSRFAAVALLAATACTGGDSSTGPVGQTIADELRHMAFVSPAELPVEHELFQLPADPQGPVNAQLCNQVQAGLNNVCQLITASGIAPYCSANAAFFLANTTPRCGARVELLDESLAPGATGFPSVFAFDLSGTPISDRLPTCGDGILDEGEECDDGNTDTFDGCDAQCFLEPFNGCEGVIQSYFEQAQIATIEQDLWVAPRSHIMVHNATKMMRPLDESVCNAAAATAVDVCNELVNTMPHVSWCAPATEMFTDELGDGCAVRFNVYFGAIDPTAGAYTTELPGILAFTLR